MKDPRIIAIVGSRSAGKTKLIETYTSRLQRDMSWKIGSINWSVKNMKLDEGKCAQDIPRYLKAGVNQSAFNSSRHTIIIKEYQSKLQKIIGMMEDLDFIFIETQQDDVGAYPQVALVKSKNEITRYINKFTAAVSSINQNLAIDHPFFVPFDSLLDVLVRKSFPQLPGLDCGQCGNVSCEEMLISLIKGKSMLEDCEPRNMSLSAYKLLVNGELIPCTGFVQEIIKKTMIGMISTLKGVDTAIKAVKLEFKTD